MKKDEKKDEKKEEKKDEKKDDKKDDKKKEEEKPWVFLLNLNAIKCNNVLSPEISTFVHFFILENTFGLWIQRQICTTTGWPL